MQRLYWQSGTDDPQPADVRGHDRPGCAGGAHCAESSTHPAYLLLGGYGVRPLCCRMHGMHGSNRPEMAVNLLERR